MLDRFDSFRDYSKNKIWKLVGLHYVFFWWLDISNYISDLLSKDKYLYDNIENVDNWNDN